MIDDIDRYLAVCLKNWAAQQQPDSTLREQVIHQAAIPPMEGKNSIVRALWDWYLFHSAFRMPPGDWFFEPFTQSRAWSFHMATTGRLAT